MIRLLFSFTFVLMLTSTLPVKAQPPGASPPKHEHQWLKQFTGEWETISEGPAGPGQPPIKCLGTMNSRMLGGFWVVNELAGDMMGTSMTGIQTIGYDEAKEKYVGTWVDSMMNHMWQYEGSIDESGKKLTLKANGPNFLEAGKTTQFRDAYEFKTADHIIVTSSMMGSDGKWADFMTGSMTRKATKAGAAESKLPQ